MHEPLNIRRTAPVEQRVDAIEAAFDERGMKPGEFIEEFKHLAEEKWIPENGARVVARAWTDPAFKQRLLANGRAAVTELGLSMPPHHRHLVVLENTPTLQNVICCTLCSCTAFTIIGLPPDWYKDLEYRSRVVRQSRTVLKEMGLDLPDGGRDPRLGHHGRHPLHGAAGATETHARMVRGRTREARHQGRDDRRRATLGRTSWTACTIWAASRVSGRFATRWTPRCSTNRGRSGSTRCIRSQ